MDGGGGSTNPSESARASVGGRGGRLISEKCFICIDRGDYVSIYNWAQSERLKRGDRPPQPRTTVTVLIAHEVKASRMPTEHLLCAWDAYPVPPLVFRKIWRGSERRGFSEPAQQGNELGFEAGA